jgi:hypothetical protein
LFAGEDGEPVACNITLLISASAAATVSPTVSNSATASDDSKRPRFGAVTGGWRARRQQQEAEAEAEATQQQQQQSPTAVTDEAFPTLGGGGSGTKLRKPNSKRRDSGKASVKAAVKAATAASTGAITSVHYREAKGPDEDGGLGFGTSYRASRSVP